jgi:hypothetical protein
MKMKMKMKIKMKVKIVMGVPRFLNLTHNLNLTFIHFSP